MYSAALRKYLELTEKEKAERHAQSHPIPLQTALSLVVEDAIITSTHITYQYLENMGSRLALF